LRDKKPVATAFTRVLRARVLQKVPLADPQVFRRIPRMLVNLSTRSVPYCHAVREQSRVRISLLAWAAG